MLLSVGLKEWSAIIEAIGTGEQSVLVRRYGPKQNDLVLYPTFNYYLSVKTRPQLFDELFRTDFSVAARKSAEETTERATKDYFVDLKYFVQVQEILSVSNPKTWKALSSYFVWSPDHVAQYAATGALLWLVRAFKLPSPVVLGRPGGGGGSVNFCTLPNPVDIEGAQPVMTEAAYSEYSKAVKEIVDKNEKVTQTRNHD